MKTIFDQDPIAAAILAKYLSPRKVRAVVTRSGHRARGVQPAKRSLGPARYESLNEQRFWQALDTSSRIVIFQTHPFVMQFEDGDKVIHYTPDCVLIDKAVGLVIFEAKAEFFLTQAKTRERLYLVAKLLQDAGLKFAVGLDVDHISMHGLLDEIQSARPVGRLPMAADPAAWDPILGTEPPPEMNQAWKDAKEMCDALIQRAMDRGADPMALLVK
jgi:hypothetical protein